MSIKTLIACLFVQVGLLAAAATQAVAAEPYHRLYDGITVFVHNPEGKAFDVSFDVGDLNHRMHGPSEMLVKAYDPDGRVIVREVIEDDGVLAPTGLGTYSGGWDHEAWYYATAYSRGINPLVKWSTLTSPDRVKAMPKRTRTYHVEGGGKGVYRLLLVGSPDHIVSLKVDGDLKYSVAGSPEWLHGHGDLYKKAYIYVPKTAGIINLHFIEFDQPATRKFRLKAPDGTVLMEGDASLGLNQLTFPNSNAWRGVISGGAGADVAPELALSQFGDQVLTLEVDSGEGDYLINVTFQMVNDFKPTRSKYQGITALLSPDPETARATQGGAIYHDDKVFWHPMQVRLYDWVSKLKPEDFECDHSLFNREGFFSVGSHQSPSFGSADGKKSSIGTADLIMHNWADHKDPHALNDAIRDMLWAMRLIGHGDHVGIGPNRNLAYEMGTYAYFWYRPAWRIIRQSNAPQEVKDILLEYVIQTGDRLAFARTVAVTNGNAFGSLMQGVRYCVEASQDPLQTEIFETIWDRFLNGGYGERAAIGPSGGLQESFGYDFHYGSYVMRGWNAVCTDLKDQRFIDCRNRMWELYSYIWFQGPGGNPWCSRTSLNQVAGGTYNSWGPYRWKGHGTGPEFVTSVMDANEWFAALRQGYYAVTYHGRLTPTWMGEGFQGQVGLGGGTICQVHIPNKGQVLSGKPTGSYGGGMHLSNWKNFHVHSMVGYTTDDLPLVTANSEHFNAKLDGTVVTSSGEVRESSVMVHRKFNFGPSAIECEVHLADTPAQRVFSLWGGAPQHRGWVREAYEMIPFVDWAYGKDGKRAAYSDPRRTKVIALDAAGNKVADLGDDMVEKPVMAAGIQIIIKDYGVVISLDEPRPIMRGKKDTLLIQVVDRPTKADDVSLSYTIAPFIGDAPALGEVASTSREIHKAYRVDPVASPDKVAAALADIEPVEVKQSNITLATLRHAVAGDNLLVHATVLDKNISHQQRVWKGSDIEIFGSSPTSLAVGQVFIAPGAAGKPATGYVPNGSQQKPTDAIKVASTDTADGYEISAIVPLELLKVSSVDDIFLLEFQVSSSTNGKNRLYQSMFGSTRAYEDNSQYGWFSFNPPQPEEDEEDTAAE